MASAGGGGNAVDRMVTVGVHGVEFITVNTDKQAPEPFQGVAEKFRSVRRSRTARGAGSKPEMGQKAADESREAIAAAIRGSDMVFITARNGRRNRYRRGPVVAEIARDMGILTVGVVTKPFAFEGTPPHGTGGGRYCRSA